MEKIKFKRTSTAGNVPTVAQCDKGELVINSTDRKLFTQDESGNVVELGASFAERYAMPKVQFDANREANKEKYAGSGFVEWGNLRNGYDAINKGMYAGRAIAPQDRLILGHAPSPHAVIQSRTGEPLVMVDGVQHNLSSVNTLGLDISADISFPSAPDGTKSYDRATGIVTDHLTYLDPKYDNTAALSQSDAVSRCFEGLCTNGDFRLGSEGWRSGSFGTVVIETELVTMQNPYGNTAVVGIYNAPYNTISIKKGNTYTVDITFTQASAFLELFFGGQDVSTISTSGLAITTPTTLTTTYTAEVDASFSFTFRRVGYASSCAISNISIRPVTSAPILTRQDLVFLESWHENTSEKQVLLPLGNSQYGASSWNGIPLKKLTDLGVGQGFSAFGQWDADTVGYGVLISELTDAQLKKFLQDPKNNIYFDAETGKLIQVRYRVRVVEGLGDKWVGVSPTPSYLSSPWGKLFYGNGITSVRPKGQLSTNMLDIQPEVWDIGGTAYICQKDGIGYFRSMDATNTVTNSDVAHQGKCFAIPICLRQTLNSGAYHPVFNSEGCAAFAWKTTTNGQVHWYDNAILYKKPTSVKDCFVLANAGGSKSTSIESGSISNSSNMRPSSFPDTYFDAVYAHQIKDLRLSAHKQDINKLRVDAMRKAVAGEMRGWGKVPFTVVKTTPTQTANGAAKGLKVNNIEQYKVGDVVSIVDGSTIVVTSAKITSITSTDIVWTIEPAFSRLAKSYTIVHAKWLTPQNDTLAWTSIAGSPENIALTFNGGISGQWFEG